MFWSVILALFLTAELTRLLLWRLLPIWRRRGLNRWNYRGRLVPTAVGALPVGLAVCGTLLLGGTDRLPFATGLAGFALLGVLDDWQGDRSVGGLRGHVQSLWRGRFTTGLLKAVGGLLVSFVVARALTPQPLEVLVGALTMSLAANALNLLDLRPGRALKVFLPFGLGLLIAEPQPGMAALLGSALAFFPEDAGERAMLGDAGANPLGFALGFALHPWATVPGYIALAVLVFLHVYSERHSLTRLIEGTPWLRVLDAIGRRQEGPS